MQTYQFIQFSPTLPTKEDCETFVPVDDAYTTAFYTENLQSGIEKINLVTPDGVLLVEGITNTTTPYTIADSEPSAYTKVHYIKPLRDYLAPGDCFRLARMQYKEDEEQLCKGKTRTVTYSELRSGMPIELLNIGGIYRNPLIPKGKWKIKIGAPRMAIYQNGYLTNTAMIVGAIKKTSALFQQGEGEEIAAKLVSPNERGVTLELDLREPTYIQIGIKPVASSFTKQGGAITHTGITYTGMAAVGYSNIMQFVENEGQFSHLAYSCNEEGTFGVLFGKAAPTPNAPVLNIQNLVPIIINKPQYGQNDKIYEKTNGEQIVLYSSITKEYSGQTDYISEELHEKITLALSCDNVLINGERLTKSDKYEIDWENQMESDCGKKLARATFKMKANVANRNSNC